MGKGRNNIPSVARDGIWVSILKFNFVVFYSNWKTTNQSRLY